MEPKKTNSDDSHILLIDDDKDIRDFLKTKLFNMGFTIFTAPDSESGFEACLNKAPDCILLDVHMPNSNGIQFLKRMRLDNRIMHTPVVMLTVDRAIEMVKKSLTYGTVGYLIKPKDWDSLAVTIQERVKEISRFHIFSFLKDDWYHITASGTLKNPEKENFLKALKSYSSVSTKRILFDFYRLTTLNLENWASLNLFAESFDKKGGKVISTGLDEKLRRGLNSKHRSNAIQFISSYKDFLGLKKKIELML